MRVVFMGTPKLAADVLESLAVEHEVVAVFTRPDAVRGRGTAVVASPVKEAAQKLGIDVYERTSFNDAGSADLVRSLSPDAACVVAWGVILPREILEIPRYGCLNVHTSLLPRWRGAAPIERAILANDDMTGVCIMRMEEGLDTGDYCRRAEVPIDGAYVEGLSDALAKAGSRELLAALDEIAAGSVRWVPQGEEGLTYAEKVAKGELALDAHDGACQLVSKVRASSGAHPARMVLEDRKLAVERASLVSDEQGTTLCADLEPGTAKFAAKRLFLQASDGVVELLQVRPDGKKSMDARSFASGIQGVKGKRLSWGRA